MAGAGGGVFGLDDVEAAAGYEVMYRGPDGWVLLSEREPSGGVSAAFEGSLATVGGLPVDASDWWFAVRARNVFGVSAWSQAAAVRAPQRVEVVPLFDPFTAPTRSGIDLERLREAVATVTPGAADCAAAPALDVEGVTVVDPPAGLDDSDAELTVAEVVRVAGGCLIVEHVALAGRTVAQVRDLLATDASVQAVGEPVRGIAFDDNTGAHTHTGTHHDDDAGAQWHLPQPTMQTLWNGWNDGTDRQVVVAVIDTGVDITHPDFTENENVPLVTNTHMRIVGSRGCHAQDNNSHGTQMAGIIAAELGGGHVAGVAPSAKILPLRYSHSVSGACGETSALLVPLTATAAVARAVNEGARVINMSFNWHAEREPTEVGGVPIEPGGAGLDTFGLALRAAAMLGVVPVAAAGNCGDGAGDGLTSEQDARCPEQDAHQRPATYDDVIAVAAIYRSGDRADFSSASVHVDVAAPGADILTASPCPLDSGCTKAVSGTSAAAAYVSGVVAHMLNRYPRAAVGQVRRALESTARDRGGVGRDDEFGHGIVDPAAAVIALSGLVEAFEPVGAGGAFESLSAGARHSCGLRAENGAVVCWGLDVVVDETPDVAFASLSSPPGGDFVCGVRLVDYAVMCWGDVPAEITSDVAGARVLDTAGATALDGRFEKVVVGDRHVCGVRPDGRVVCWGDNASGQTDAPVGGLGSSSAHVTAIAAGGEHMCALAELTGLVCWGEDQGGRLPPSSSTVVARQIAAGAVNTCVIGSNDQLVCFGSNSRGVLDAPAGRFASLDAGSHHVCAISASRGRGLRCWGDSGDGRLAAPAGQFLQVAAGGRHSCALNVFARVVCWGDNSDGQAPQQARLNSLSLTAGGTDLLAGRFIPDVFDYTVTTSESRATLHAEVGGIDEAHSRIVIGSGVGGALSTTGPVELSDGALIEVRVRALWGHGALRTYRIRVVVQPRLASLSVRASGSGATCSPVCPALALTPAFDRDVFDYSVVAPADVSEVTVSFVASGGAALVVPVDADSALAGHQVDLGVDGGFVAIDAGWDHTCGLKADGSVLCWGDNEFGQLSAPSGVFAAVAAGGLHSCGLRTDGAITCWGDNDFGQLSAPSGVFVSVAAGGLHSCGLRTDGAITCWGLNLWGQVSAPSGAFTAVSAGGGYSCGLRTNGTITCWGINSLGQTNHPSGVFVAIDAGRGHACARRADNTLACWGSNGDGQAQAPSGTFSSVMVGDHSCAVAAGGAVSCWGSNTYGQLDAASGPFAAVTAAKTFSCGLDTGGTVVCWGGPASALEISGPVRVTVTVTDSSDPLNSALYTVTITRESSLAAGAAQRFSHSGQGAVGLAAGGSEADSPRSAVSTGTSATAQGICPSLGGQDSGAVVVGIPDAALRAAINRQLARAPGAQITSADMAAVTLLSLSGPDTAPGAVTDITGLQHAVNLHTLDLYGHSVSDLAPLSCATGLRSLNLGQIADLAALRGLVGLERLYLYDNQISDLAPLGGLAGLDTLYLDHNDITDISALPGLTGLVVLGLGDNDITTVASLSGLSSLQTLYLFDNDITDAAALSRLTSLETLWVDGNDLASPYNVAPAGGLGYLDARHNLIADVAPLDGLAAPGGAVHSEPQRTATVRVNDASLRAALLAALGKTAGETLSAAEIATIERFDRIGPASDPAPIRDLSGLEHAAALRDLRLRNNAITSIEPIAALDELERLDLHSNSLADLGQLDGLTSLRWLNLLQNGITSIDELPALDELEMLFLDFNQITDIAPLAGRRSLTRLGLVGDDITDITPLAVLTNLDWVMLSGNNITDITTLASLHKIYYLRLSSNNIVDVAPLAGLARLTNLHLYRSNITDLTPLRDLTGLEFLDLRDNNITDLEPLRGLTGLKDLHIGDNQITDFTPLDGITGLTIHGQDDQTPSN